MTNELNNPGIVNANQEKLNLDSPALRAVTEPVSQKALNDLNVITQSMYQALSGEVNPFRPINRTNTDDSFEAAIAQNNAEMESNRVRMEGRSFGEVVTDTGLGLAKSVNTIAEQAYGVTNLASIGLDRLSGGDGSSSLDGALGWSRNFRDTREIYNQLQSESLQARRESMQRRMAEYSDEKEQRMALRAEAAGRGENNFWDAAKDVGGEALLAMQELWNDKGLLADSVIETGLSYLVPGAAANGLRRAGFGVMGSGREALRKGLPEATIRRRLARENAAIGSVSIAGMEGASNAMEARTRVLDMTHDELLQQSPIYADLLATHSDDIAREIVANNVFATTFGASGIIAGASAGITGAGRLEAGLFRRTGRGIVRGAPGTVVGAAGAAGQEAAQELFQSGGGQLSQNIAIRQFADIDQDILEDVGTAAGMGMIAGGAMGGGASLVANSLPNMSASAKTIVKGAKDRQTRREAEESVKQGKPTSKIKSMLDPNNNEYAPAIAISHLLDQRTLSNDALKDPTKFQNHLVMVQTELANAKITSMNKLQEIMKNAPEGTNVKETKEFQDAFANYNALNEQQKILNKITDNNLEQGRAFERYDEIINDIAQRDDSLTDDDVGQIFEVFGSSPDSITPEILAKLEASPNEQVRTRATIFREAQETQDLIKRNKEKGIKGVNLDVIQGGPGFLGIQDYLSNIRTAARLKDTNTATQVLQDFNGFAVSHMSKASLAEDIYQGINRGEDVTELQETYTDLYSTKDFNGEIVKRATIHGRSGHLVKALQEEANALDKAVKEAQAIVEGVSPATQTTTTETTDVPVESVTEAPTVTESAPTETVDETPARVQEPVSAVDAPTETVTEPTTETEQNNPQEVVQESTQETTNEDTTTEQLKEAFAKDESNFNEAAYNKRQLQDLVKEQAQDILMATVNGLQELGYRVPKKQLERLSTAMANQLSQRVTKVPLKSINNSARAFARGVQDTFTGNIRNDIKNPWYNSAVERTQRDLLPNFHTLDRVFTRNVGKVHDLVMGDMFTRSKPTTPLQTTENLFQQIVNNPEQYLTSLENSEVSAFASFKRYHKRIEEALNAKTANGNYKYIGNLEHKIGVLRDPTRLLTNEEGGFDPNTITAIALSGFNWLQENAFDLQGRTDSLLRQHLDLNSSDSLPINEYVNEVRDFGFLASWAHRSVGQNVINMLGLKNNKSSTHPEMYEKMTVALGQTAIDIMLTEEVGALRSNAVSDGHYRNTVTLAIGENVSSDTGDSTINMLYLNGQFQKNTFLPSQTVREFLDEDSKLGYSKLSEKVFQEETTKQMPSLEGPLTFKQKKLKRSQTDVPQEVGESVQKLMNQSIQYKTRNMRVAEVMGEAYILSYAGFVEDVKALPKYKQDNVERGTNPAIKRDYDAMMQFYQHAQDKKFWVGHEVWKNFRLGMVGPINMQSSKMHRAMMGYSDHIVTIEPNDSNAHKYFKLALAQHFGFDIDKQSAAKSIAQLNELVSKPEFDAARTSILALDRDGDSMPDEVKAEHRRNIDKAIQLTKEKDLAALDALINWAHSSETEAFTTNIYLEIDGVTNGVILSLLQLMPYHTDEMIRRLNAGGLYFGDQWKDFSEYKEDGRDDTYEFLGTVLQQELSIAVSDQPENVQRGLNLLIQLTAKEARKLAKNPTMITSYGAGADRVISETVQALIEGMYDNIVTNEKDRMVAAMEALGVELTKTQYQQLNENPAEFILNKKQEQYLTEGLKATFGEALKTSLDETYGPLIQRQREMNRAINFSFALFKKAFDHKRNNRLLQEQENNPELLSLSREVEQEIFDDLLDAAPIIETFYSSGITEGYLAMDNARSVNMDNNFRTVKEYSVPLAHTNNKGKKVKSSVGRPDIHEFISAGLAGYLSNIHALDAAIMTKTIKTQNVLNVHDAIGVSVLDAVNAATDINRNFLEISTQHNIPQQVHVTVLSSVQRVTNLLGEEEVYSTLLGSFHPESKNKPRSTDYYVGYLANMASSIQSQKEELLSRASNVGQYHLVDASLSMQEEQERRAEQEDLKSIIDEIVLELTKDQEENLQIVKRSREIESFNEFGRYDSYNSNLGSSDASFTGFTPDTEITVTPGNSMNLLHRLLQQDGSVNSEAHSDHLGRVMGNVVNKVLQPIQVAIQEMSPETKGRFFTRENRIEIALANPVLNESQQSQAEVYAHEMMHVVTHYGLEQDSPARRVLQRFYASASNHIKVSDLYPDNATDAQKAQTQRLYDYVFNNTQKAPVRHTDPITGAVTTHHKNASLHEFLAFGTTNQKMIEALNKHAEAIHKDMLKVPSYSAERRTTQGGVIPQILTNITNWFMDKVAELFNNIQLGRLKLKGLTPQESLLKIAESIAEIERDNTGNMFKRKTYMDRADAFLVAKMEQFVLAPISKLGGSRVMKESPIKSIRSIGGIMENAPHMHKGYFMRGLRSVTRRMGILHDSLIVAVAREMLGQHEGNRRMFGLLRRSKTLVDQTSKRVGISTKTLLNDMYATDLSPEDKVAINQLLKVDVSSLLITDTNLRTQTNKEIDDEFLGESGKRSRTANMRNIQRLLDEPDFRKAEIQRLQDAIYGVAGIQPKTATYYIEQAIGLGHRMLNITDGMAPDQMANAHAIAELAGSAKDVFAKPKDTEQVQVLIDQLATIKGLDLLDSHHLERASQVINREITAGKTLDDNGLVFTLRLHSQFKKDSMGTLFGNSPMQMTKGWTKQIIDPSIKLQVAPLSEARRLNKQGYKVIGPLNDDRDNPVRGSTKEPMMLYRSTSDKDATWQKMIVSLSRNQASGQGIIEALSNSNSFNMYHENMSIDDALKVQEKVKEAKARKVSQTGTTPRQHKGEMLVPVIDDQGDITGYRYMMGQETRERVLVENQNFDEVLAQMHSTMSTKSNSKTINREVIEALKEEYDNNFTKDPTRFIKVASDASGQPNPREGRNAKEYSDMWAMLPYEMQRDIESIFGEAALYVPEDFYKLVFGYRKNNMRDFVKGWEQKATKQAVKEAMKHLHSIVSHRAFMITEDIWKELVSMAKDAIVIKSGIVLVGNITSNVMMLLMSGVTPTALIKHHRDGYRYVREYQDTVRNIDILQQQLKVDKTLNAPQRKRLEAKVSRLQNDLQNNPARELLDAGVYQSIVEDVSLEEDPFTFKSRLEKSVDPVLKRTPQTIKDLGNMMFITHDTQLYKALRNTTQISDFVARYTLHQVNKQRGMSFEESINDIMDSFIDYESPTHEGIQYANDVGLLMFTKFFFRIQKMLAKRMSGRPASTLTYLLLQQAIGYDLADVFDEGGWNAEKWSSKTYTPDYVLKSILNGNLAEFTLASGIGRPM